MPRNKHFVGRYFPARIGHLRAVLDFVARRAERVGLEPRRILYLRLVVEEIVVNVCRHAYAGRGGRVSVLCTADPASFVVEVGDQGRPFNPLVDAPSVDTSASLEERRPGGLGVFLAKFFVDELRYRRENDRNIVTVVCRR